MRRTKRKRERMAESDRGSKPLRSCLQNSYKPKYGNRKKMHVRFAPLASVKSCPCQHQRGLRRPPKLGIRSPKSRKYPQRDHIPELVGPTLRFPVSTPLYRPTPYIAATNTSRSRPRRRLKSPSHESILEF